jgi:hypothetical protein
MYEETNKLGFRYSETNLALSLPLFNCLERECLNYTKVRLKHYVPLYLRIYIHVKGKCHAYASTEGRQRYSSNPFATQHRHSLAALPPGKGLALIVQEAG